MTRTWSVQQQAIFGWFSNESPLLAETRYSQNLVVRARAGTGKTTTIIEGVNRAPEQKILLCAFNKRIADELTSRLTNPRAQAKTLHSIGFGIIRRYKPQVRVLNGSERADKLTEAVCGPKAPDTIKKLVSRLHTKGREMAPHAREMGELTNIAIDFECEPDESWQAQGFDTAYVEAMALKAMELAANTPNEIDFSDMIFLPVRNGWLNKVFDLVVVDEAQDMTLAQLEIALGVCRGRICVVGDDRQAIYGFRGADSQSLDRLKVELQAQELGLTTTYRCGHSIVMLAASLVPDFQAGPSNPAGSIRATSYNKITEQVALGDFVLSRLNAPLVSLAMSFLKAGKRTRIAGRDIGKGLTALVRKLAKGKAAHSIPELFGKIAGWREREIDRMLRAKREDRVDIIRDQADMLIELAQASSSVQDMEHRIEALFTDDGLGQAGVITCSSVHRAKGLEADRVYVLQDTLRDKNIEELNIQYVAITRAKHELVWVNKAMPGQ